MSRTEYFLHIGVAGKAGELHELRHLAEADAELTPEQRGHVRDAIGRRFAELNQKELVQKSRWDTSPRPSPHCSADFATRRGGN